MKSILVLTDFSREANFVAEFAINLAITAQANLTFCHVLDQNNHQNIDSRLSDRYLTENENMFDLSDQLDLFNEMVRTNQGSSAFKPNIECRVEFGHFADTAERIVKEHAIDFVMVGSRKTISVSKFQFGSQTYTLPDKFKCPVLLIPAGSKFEGINLILYASDLPANNQKALQFLGELAKPFKAVVKVSHIVKKSQPVKISEKSTADSLNEQLGRNYPKLIYQTLKDDSVDAGLRQMIRKEKINILALVHRKYQFLEGVFHESLSKLMAGIAIPLLILPNSFISEETIKRRLKRVGNGQLTVRKAPSRPRRKTYNV